MNLPEVAPTHHNPSHEWLREQALSVMPGVTENEYGNLSYQSRVTSRLGRSTFFVAEREIHQNAAPRIEATEWSRRQDESLRNEKAWPALRRGVLEGI